jgi:cyclopropane-fatty-acyl-phospholipid synthase
VETDRLIRDLLGDDLPIAVEGYDGTRVGPPDAPARIVIRSVDALRRILFAPGELGFARAYVAGDLDVDGDMFAALELRDRLPDVHITPRQAVAIAQVLGRANLRPVAPPPEEARLHGRRHSTTRDAEAVTHHYDVSNAFYRLVLGPSMTYSCALFERPERSLEDAQEAKHELVCQKLALQPGMRLLDIGCGWGGMAIHAARHHDVKVVGVTLSRAQLDYARKRVAEAGLSHAIDLRLQHSREIDDGPFDAVSSIGMFEHVGRDQMDAYFADVFRLLRPGHRYLHHAIALPWRRAPLVRRPTFMSRYVFPDSDLPEVGHVMTAIHRAGLEARHFESLREHYALTLRAWSANLARNWDDAVAEAGLTRARIWRLYMAACALGFEANRIQIHQTLAVRPDGGRSGLPLRPTY